MQTLSDQGISWIDVQFIKTSTLQLMEAREMLKWTYVYGYYLPENINRDLFEYLQADLESGTEKLSLLLESNEKKDKDRVTILNASAYVKQRVKNLLEGLADGDITGGKNEEKSYGNEHSKYDGWIYNAGN
eukprot:TRINITY_DN4163_c0_g1_i3.p1 TRINITY_DN4163_c0_g1~~TRINITY_DN4163_c0_g1_i3.p1  ORF type:complete len:131 (-),score=25.08 TRINITY_DN4163_c0_g1_i3:189-581(-)